MKTDTQKKTTAPGRGKCLTEYFLYFCVLTVFATNILNLTKLIRLTELYMAPAYLSVGLIVVFLLLIKNSFPDQPAFMTAKAAFIGITIANVYMTEDVKCLLLFILVFLLAAADGITRLFTRRQCLLMLLSAIASLELYSILLTARAAKSPSVLANLLMPWYIDVVFALLCAILLWSLYTDRMPKLPSGKWSVRLTGALCCLFFFLAGGMLLMGSLLPSLKTALAETEDNPYRLLRSAIEDNYVLTLMPDEEKPEVFTARFAKYTGSDNQKITLEAYDDRYFYIRFATHPGVLSAEKDTLSVRDKKNTTKQLWTLEIAEDENRYKLYSGRRGRACRVGDELCTDLENMPINGRYFYLEKAIPQESVSRLMELGGDSFAHTSFFEDMIHAMPAFPFLGFLGMAALLLFYLYLAKSSTQYIDTAPILLYAYMICYGTLFSLLWLLIHIVFVLYQRRICDASPV